MWRCAGRSALRALLTGLSALQALGQAAPQNTHRCNDTTLQRIGAHFGLEHVAYPRDGTSPSAENGGLIISGTCKPWPGSRKRTVAALAYETGLDEKALLLAIVDSRTGVVVASHRDAIVEDSATAVREHSVSLDTAPYILSTATRAFGVRLNTFLDRCGYEGGSDGQLTLLVANGKVIRPIFTEPMRHWHYLGANRCNGEDVPFTTTSTSIIVQRTSTNGLADLVLVARRSDGKKALTATVKYDGNQYDLSPWRGAFSRWWDR